MNFSARRCKRCLISWKSTRNHRFGQHYATFGTNYHVFAFRSTFKERLKKVVHFAKNHEKSWIWSKLATFRTNCHVSAFRWTFNEKVGKSGSFREKARKLMHFLKTCNCSNKQPCFDVSMNFSAKSCKNFLIWWKSTKNHRFGQNYATFSNKLPSVSDRVRVRVRVSVNPNPNPNP